MASIGITASIQRGRSSPHIANKPSTRTLVTRQATHVVTPNVQHLKLQEKPDKSPLVTVGSPKVTGDKSKTSDEQSHPKFSDVRWKNGTWDLNMFVKNGTMDWDSVIVAEARRRKYLEVHPEASNNEEPVMFRSSIIPLWAWILHSHLPEAELLNGRAAMVGFFVAYLVDALTGLDMVGQTGNFFCKAALFFTIIGVLLFRRKEDVENIKKIADEAVYYDKQWQASWQNPDATAVSEEKIT